MKPAKILVVDDSAVVCRMARMIMEEYGRTELDIHCAEDGREALSTLRKHPDTAVMFVDMYMPTMGGAELLTLLRADTALRSLPVVVWSTGSSPETRDQMLAAGAKEYVTKPFQAEEIHDVLDRLLASSAAGS